SNFLRSSPSSLSLSPDIRSPRVPGAAFVLAPLNIILPGVRAGALAQRLEPRRCATARGVCRRGVPAEDARLGGLVFRLRQHPQLLEASVLAHLVTEIPGLGAAPGRGGQLNVRGNFLHEAPHAAERSEATGAFQDPCSAYGAEQPHGLG